MATQAKHDSWSAGQNYEHYMGRWSRKIAAAFLDWLKPAKNADWVEIGCGTGALSQMVLTKASPQSLLITDQSADFLNHTKEWISDDRAKFEVADAENLPLNASSVDIVASALVFNFIPDRVAALKEMQRVLRPGGSVAFYVWDYPGGGMGFIDVFWKAAAALDPTASELDEAGRFPFCTVAGLAAICTEAGLENVVIEPVEVETVFDDFEAFWHPFTLGAGPAPGYVQTLDEKQRAALKGALKAQLGASGKVRLPARAWAVKATT